jgi:uncharacterized membrane protein YdjX (TVP38/TMEM64 family)
VFLNLVGGALFGVPIGVPLCCLLNASGASCCYLLVAACRDSVGRIAYVRKRLTSLVIELNAQLGEQAFAVDLYGPSTHSDSDVSHSSSSSESDLKAPATASNAYQSATEPTMELRQRVQPVPEPTSHSADQQTSGSTKRLLVVLTGLRLLPLCPQWLVNLASPIIGVPLRVFFASALLGLLPYNFICVQTGSVLRELRSLDSLFRPTTLVQLLLVAAACLFAPAAFRKLRARFASTSSRAA